MSVHNELQADIKVLVQTVVVAINAIYLFVYSAYNNCQLVARRYYIATTQACHQMPPPLVVLSSTACNQMIALHVSP